MPEGTREIPYPDVDIAVVRRYANRRANTSSVRQLAELVGMRHQSLEKFLDGAEPYAKNRGLLCRWYLSENPGQEPDGGAADAVRDAAACLAALLHELRGEARSEARLRIRMALAQGYRRMGLPDPGWLHAEP